MSAHLFNESGQISEVVEIPDIFDVLEGGEDENAVKFLLGFNGEEGSGDVETSSNPSNQITLQPSQQQTSSQNLVIHASAR